MEGAGVLLRSGTFFLMRNDFSKKPAWPKTELELSGLDPEALEFMKATERRRALEGAGLDPKKYDF